MAVSRRLARFDIVPDRWAVPIDWRITARGVPGDPKALKKLLRGKFRLQVEAITRARFYALSLIATGTIRGATLRVHSKRGTFSREMTYPRAVDPRRSKG